MSTIPYRVATFDCYGTLIDWEGGVGSFLYGLALEHGDANLTSADVMREDWESIQLELNQGAYRPYKEILSESLRRWMAERGYPWSPERGAGLVRAMRSWQPFPDTGPALRQVKASGLRLAILSNTDNDIIAHSLRHLGVSFDDVITAEDVGAYKPERAHFERALDRTGEPPERILHVAFGFTYDIPPAKQLGFATAWVNRHAEAAPDGDRPNFVWRDLWGLAALVGAQGPGF